MEFYKKQETNEKFLKYSDVRYMYTPVYSVHYSVLSIHMHSLFIILIIYTNETHTHEQSRLSINLKLNLNYKDV